MRVGSDSTGVLQSEGIENRQIGRAPATRQGPLHPTHFRRAVNRQCGKAHKGAHDSKQMVTNLTLAVDPLRTYGCPWPRESPHLWPWTRRSTKRSEGTAPRSI